MGCRGDKSSHNSRSCTGVTLKITISSLLDSTAREFKTAAPPLPPCYYPDASPSGIHGMKWARLEIATLAKGSISGSHFNNNNNNNNSFLGKNAITLVFGAAIQNKNKRRCQQQNKNRAGSDCCRHPKNAYSLVSACKSPKYGQALSSPHLPKSGCHREGSFAPKQEPLERG